MSAPAGGPLRFAAIDFETSDYQSDSACALAVVVVEDGAVVSETVRLIRPPREHFVFSYLHGITWEQVRGEPGFAELWPVFRPLFEGVRFIAAHNASFDRGVLERCCAAAGVPSPPLPWLCTVKLARRAFKLFPTNLAAVCKGLDIPLKHHEALSDASACARIVTLALEKGANPMRMLLRPPRRALPIPP